MEMDILKKDGMLDTTPVVIGHDDAANTGVF